MKNIKASLMVMVAAMLALAISQVAFAATNNTAKAAPAANPVAINLLLSGEVGFIVIAPTLASQFSNSMTDYSVITSSPNLPTLKNDETITNVLGQEGAVNVIIPNLASQFSNPTIVDAATVGFIRVAQDKDETITNVLGQEGAVNVIIPNLVATFSNSAIQRIDQIGTVAFGGGMQISAQANTAAKNPKNNTTSQSSINFCSQTNGEIGVTINIGTVAMTRTNPAVTAAANMTASRGAPSNQNME